MVQELNFQAYNEDRLPPQNIEAEESILGGILLDPEAIARIREVLIADAFYISAHREIYNAAQALHDRGLPTDLISITAWLNDNGMLGKIGGQSKLAQLVERTVSAVNIDRYAALVMDKYLRRQLIKAGYEINQLGYETSSQLDIVLDRAEQKIFGVTQKRPQRDFVSIENTLVHTFHEIELRNEEQALPGLMTNFYDLDAMTGGLQRSDLIIIAGRPSMGKTAVSLNIAHQIAANYRLPVAVFSLEMSKEQLVQRLLASEAGIESQRLRAGRISQNEWEPLSHAIGILSELPIFIDDTANLTVTEMRSKSRRLLAERGGEIGLIVLDYLQLMEGSGSDNRVQELSRITRSLKGLARELNVPVIALSQLSRGVEARTNKRPMLSDLRESGSIEQDADIVLMVYRDEYYFPDSPDRGVTELIITKHRNGPTGVVKLLFDPQYTRFRNMASRDR
jgi:replicative DNA helicase